MSLSIKKQDKPFTYADYLSWPDDERWELINGTAYDMSPAPSRRHQDILRELSLQIAGFLQDKPCRIYYAPFDVRLPEGNETEKEIKTVVQPDLVIICDEKKLDDKGCIGAPDIIIEILSPATAVKDKIEKFSIYEKHKVKEYWLVEPSDNTVMVFTLGKNKEYGKPKTYSEKITTPILEGLEIDLKQIFV
jgi:Uma2 family endonuclease